MNALSRDGFVCKAMSAESLIRLFPHMRLLGEGERHIIGAMSIEKAGRQDMTFCVLHGEMAAKAIACSEAGLVICHRDVPDLETLAQTRCIAVVENPRLAFLRCIKVLYTPEIDWGVHSTALIGADVQFPEKIKVGAYACIEPGVEIGDSTIVESRVHIGAGTKIGNNVYLQTGCIIGCEGQGFERNEQMQFEKFHQHGSVVIEDNVEVGANSTIVRGTFSETRVGRGSKIGHLTDIGHNVQIGIHTFVSACVLIGGSAVIGDYSWLAPKCCIRNKVKVGKNVTVGLGAVVLKDVNDGVTVVGNPAKILRTQQ